MGYIRNFLCASRFWMRLLSSGSVTSVQLSDFDDLDLGEEEEEEEEWCFLELEWWLWDDEEGILASLLGSGSMVGWVRLVIRGDATGEVAGLVEYICSDELKDLSAVSSVCVSGQALLVGAWRTVSWEDVVSDESFRVAVMRSYTRPVQSRVLRRYGSLCIYSSQ